MNNYYSQEEWSCKARPVASIFVGSFQISDTAPLKEGSILLLKYKIGYLRQNLKRQYNFDTEI
jgi:hypothetical protein